MGDDFNAYEYALYRHSFGSLNNTDTVDNVFGAQDGFLTVGLKANWQFSKSLKLSAAVDNLFDEQTTFTIQAEHSILKPTMSLTGKLS